MRPWHVLHVTARPPVCYESFEQADIARRLAEVDLVFARLEEVGGPQRGMENVAETLVGDLRIFWMRWRKR